MWARVEAHYGSWTETVTERVTRQTTVWVNLTNHISLHKMIIHKENEAFCVFYSVISIILNDRTLQSGLHLLTVLTITCCIPLL